MFSPALMVANPFERLYFNALMRGRFHKIGSNPCWDDVIFVSIEMPLRNMGYFGCGNFGIERMG
jgi:hypothetical protein